MTKVTHPDGTWRQFTYTANGLDLLSYRDERGKIWTYTVDAAGNRLTATDPLGNVTTYTYDTRGNLLTETTPDPDGTGPLAASVTTYEYDTRDRVTEIINPDLTGRSYFYDPVTGNVATETDEREQITFYTYDAYGRISTVTLPDPDGPGPQAAPVWSYGYCGCGSLTSVTDPLGNVTSYDYDDATGLLESITSEDPDGTGPLPPLVTSYTYDALGRVLTETAPGNRVTSYEYDGNGNLTKLTGPDPDGAGPLAAAVWTYAYDALNRLTTVTAPDPDGAGPLSSLVTSYAYDSVGNLVSAAALGRTTSYGYDEAGNLTQVILADPDGAGPLTSPETAYAYDDAGRLVSTTGSFVGATAGQEQTASYAYDAAGRLVSVTLPDPDGTGPLASPVHEYAYDARHRLVWEEDPLDERTSYAYDAVGNLTSLTDASLNTTTWGYDGLGRVIWETNELNDSRTFEYDVASRLTKRTDRDGRAIISVYDAVNRLRGEKWLAADGVTVVYASGYSYDASGDLAWVVDDWSAYSYTYDQAGRLTSIDENTPGRPNLDVELDYEYDTAGRRTGLDATVNAAADLTNDYTYDAFGQLTRIEQSGTGVANKRVDLAYDDLGRFESITRFEDLAGTLLVATSAYAYDGLGRLTGLTHAKGANVLADYDYGYDLLDRLTSATTPDGTVTYDYDQTSQLTAADHSSQTDESYSYDSTGNRTNTGYSTGANNRLLSDGTYNYEYDAEGNRTKRTEIATDDYVEYRWDNRNRLTIVTSYTSAGLKTKEVEYRYDMFDRRIAKDVDENGDGVIEWGEWYVYDGEHIVIRTDRDGNVTNRYLHGPAIDQLFSDESAVDGVLWALADHQGTIRDWADYDAPTDATTVTNHVEYDSFGIITAQSDANHEVLFAYTGREWDADAELYYYRARWYDPVVGRFVSEDPIGFAGGDVNLRRYVGNSPTNYIDPSGLADVFVGGEVDVVGIVGVEFGGGLVVDIDTPLDSGIFVNGGPAGGANVGAALGAGFTLGDIEGNALAVDVNAFDRSGQFSVSDNGDLGGGVSVGPGGGASASYTKTGTLSVGNIWNFCKKVGRGLGGPGPRFMPPPL